MNDKPFCKNYQVACGSYNCNYADVVNNTIICTAKTCNYQSIYNPIKLKAFVKDNEVNLNDEDPDAYPF